MKNFPGESGLKPWTAPSPQREPPPRPPLRTPFILMATALLACGLMGCASSGNKSGSVALPPSGSIEEIHLLSVPMALNMDPAPGPDGFAVKVFATSRNHSKAMPITKGTLEIMMFDGTVPSGNWESLKPLRTWSFPANILRDFISRGSLGVDYQLAPLWGEAKPTHPCITIVARYRLANDRTLYSGPSIISVGTQ